MTTGTRPSLRLPLMLLHLITAVALLWAAANQAKAKALEAGGTLPWDYAPPAKTILSAVNFPATVAMGLITQQHDVALEHSFWRYCYLFFIACLWYTVGLCIDRRYLSNSATMKTPFVILGLIATSFLCLVAIGLIRSPSAPILVVGAFVWSGLLLYFFGRLLLVNRQRPHI